MVRSDQNAAPLSLRAATPAWRLRKKLPWTNGYRVASAEVQRAMGESAALRGILLKFTQVFTSQSTQSAACNARHRTEQRLARWLLLAHDCMADATGCRLPTNISHSCSVSAPGVTVALHSFKGEKLVRAGRGQIMVTDRTGLERRSACYRIVTNEAQRVLGTPGTIPPPRSRGFWLAVSRRARVSGRRYCRRTI